MEKDATALDKILEHLVQTLGRDFRGNRPAMIERRLSRRLAATGAGDFDRYLARIREDPKEAGLAAAMLTINISCFFRNPLTFEYLAAMTVPQILKEKIRAKERSVRIWSAGCASGEEAYSMAILLAELMQKEADDLEPIVFATDIDDRALAVARKGIYPPERLRNVRYGLLKRSFTPAGQLFTVNADIRDRVFFDHFDMLEKERYAPPQSVFGSFDMVLCRNVLIYFDTAYQEIIFDKLYRSLSEGGHLVLGRSEVPADRYRGRFIKVSENCPVYQKVK